MERNAKTGNRKELGREKSLFWLLGGLVALAVILVVGIVVVAVNGGKRGGDSGVISEGSDTDSKYLQNVEIAETKTREMAEECLAEGVLTELMICLSEKEGEIYEQGDDIATIIEDTDELYGTVVNALEQGEFYEEVAAILSDQMRGLAVEGDCVAAIEVVENADMTAWRPADRLYLYSDAIGVAQYCHDETLVEKYTQISAAEREKLEQGYEFED